jgi:DNA-binding CsgD family transcriptional regulator
MAIRDVTVVDWTGRYDGFTGREASLTAPELAEYGQAAWFTGRDDIAAVAWERAHLTFLDDGDPVSAVRCVFWLGFTLGERGEEVKARTWMARLFELCARHAGDPTIDATAALCRGQVAFLQGDHAGSVVHYREGARLAEGAEDPDVQVLAIMGEGRALMRSGHLEEGVACMDRVMLLIGSGRVSDRTAGPAYCAVIASLLARADIERARVWTRDLGDWCDTQRGLEPFRGECTLHRATVMQVGGEWGAAVEAADSVCRTEERPETLANAWYRLAELHRVVGRSAAARDAYRRAAGLGREVQPGLALLNRDAGDLDTAWAGLERARATVDEPAARAEVLAAAVDIALGRRQIAAAREAAADLRRCADAVGTLSLRATSAHADGELAIAESRTTDALQLLRSAWSQWRRLDAPYDAARVRYSMGRAARAAGDEEGAQLEFDAARAVFESLGAVPDLARLERVASAPTSAAVAEVGLSRREREVLDLVAAGLSNRRIAERLFLSERTVAHHVGSILAKLDVPSRSAATAYAFEHGLVPAS